MNKSIKNSVCSNGFTLIELAIVVIIIGLLVAGVLQGKELIEQARMQAQIKQFQEMNAGANTFKSKYNCLPGDCRNQTTYVPAHGCFFGDGDGDGLVYDTFRNGTNPYPGGMTGEVSYFPYVMYYTKMFRESPDLSNCGVVGPIKDRKGGASGTIVTSINSQNGYYWGIDILPTAGNPYGWAIFAVSTRGVITPETAYSFDLKIDDGLPMQGNVYSAWVWGGDNRVHPEDGRTGCMVSNSNQTYNTTNQNIVCRPFVRANF